MLSPAERNATSRQQFRDRERARLASAEGACVSRQLLDKIARDHTKLSQDEEVQLANEITAAKQELYRLRGGADRELQLAHDFGEICE